MYDALAKTMRSFDEYDLDKLLGKLSDSLIEWSIGKEMLLKGSKIDILLGVYGLNLFKKELFRQDFFLSLSKEILLQCAEIQNIDTDLTLEVIADFLSKVPFKKCELYNYIIKNVLRIDNYVFVENKKESNVESFEIDSDKEKFTELYDYQYMIKQQAIHDLENPDKGLYRILIHMPTGTGKTKTTMHIIAHNINYIEPNGLVIWIAHSDELLVQAYESFINIWSHLGQKKINIYKGWNGYPDEFSNGILFTSIQALLKKQNKPVFDFFDENASLIVFDEVHKGGAKKYSECIDRLMENGNSYNKKFIGLTATPGRTTDYSTENAIFRSEFDRIIRIDVDLINCISLTKNEAENYSGSKEVIRYFQERKILAKLDRKVLDYKNVDVEVLQELKKEFHSLSDDYSKALLEKISMNKLRNIKIVEELEYLYRERIPTIVFACSLQHAQMLSAFLKLSHISNSLIYGDMDPFLRKKSIDDFKNNKVNFIINYEILTTGFDSTNIGCVFITRPTKSVVLYSQMIGRGLRGPYMGGNERCLLIDVEENLEAFNENSAFEHFDDYWR